MSCSSSCMFWWIQALLATHWTGYLLNRFSWVLLRLKRHSELARRLRSSAGCRLESALPVCFSRRSALRTAILMPPGRYRNNIVKAFWAFHLSWGLRIGRWLRPTRTYYDPASKIQWVGMRDRALGLYLRTHSPGAISYYQWARGRGRWVCAV